MIARHVVLDEKMMGCNSTIDFMTGVVEGLAAGLFRQAVYNNSVLIKRSGFLHDNATEFSVEVFVFSEEQLNKFIDEKIDEHERSLKE